MTPAIAKDLESLNGSIERITFHSGETGFCVLRTKVKQHRDLVTVIGNAASISPGEFIECKGIWINDKKHGLQFKASTIKVIPPSTVEGIEKYLGSGMVKGIGPHFAKKLVKTFGEDVFDIIESQPQRLLDLEGIGKKRLTLIISAWEEQKNIRNIMVFLQSYGIGSARAVRIFKVYGDKAIDKISENPYCLTLDIRGIGFKTADKLALELGIGKDSLIRAQAGVRHVLNDLCDKGHMASTYENLTLNAHSLLDIPISIIEEAIKNEITLGNLVEDYIDKEPCIFPISLFRAETKVAENIKRLIHGKIPWGAIDLEPAIKWTEKQSSIELSQSQKNALKIITNSKVSIITGGPGVGKTTLINSFLKIILAKKVSIALCAPTGRAAKRLTETTKIQAKTIHRLLEFQPKNYNFKFNENNPLPIELLVIDESSMIDIVLLNSLLKALPSYTAIVFVGDIDQLPSVGSGAILGDLIASETIPCVKLTEIFRQAKNSNIIINAHRINQGKMPLPNSSPTSDFFTIYTDDSITLQEKLVQIVCKRLPKFYNCNVFRDIQILTPLNKGALGSRNLNALLQKELNAQSEPKITRFGITFAPNDKVIQMTNNYDKEVFNGDIGFIEKINLDDGIVHVRFDDQIKNYEVHELDELSLAYAISIHKSQGSEFPIVVIPIATEHYTLLARNLLYTALTRGKKLVVLIGQKKAIGIAVSNNKEAQRLTKLKERLQN